MASRPTAAINRLRRMRRIRREATGATGGLFEGSSDARIAQN
jgi:hypothetical protein